MVATLPALKTVIGESVLPPLHIRTRNLYRCWNPKGRGMLE